MNRSKLIFLPTFKDERGSLTVLEKKLDFPIKRIYWIYGTHKQKRGGHRHKETKQALISLYGQVSVQIVNKEGNFSYLLDNPTKCLILEPDDWHDMEFNKNAVLLIAASHFFDENDYIDSIS